MGFDWEKYLELADHMCNNSNDFPDKEACYRSSTSRAYYAALCCTRRYIEKTDGITFKGGDSHFQVKRHLKESGHKLKRKIASQLKTIKRFRERADYHDSLGEQPSNLSGKTLKQAKAIIAEINSLP